MLDVCLLGTSGMMPLPGRWLTALMLRYNGSSMLIDAGEGTQVTLRKKGWSPYDIDTILFTHYHGDHISGLPGLLLSMGNSDRTKPVKIIGPKGIKSVVNKLLVIAQGLPFELEFTEMDEAVHEFNINGLRIRAFKVDHSITCYGYSVYLKRIGRFFPEKAKEHNIPLKYWNLLQKGEIIEKDGIKYTPDMVLGPERQGLKVTYCTDTRPVDIIAEEGKNSDIIILEGMYGDIDKLSDAKKKKHMLMQEAAEIARKSDSKELWFTHYSPSVVYPEQYMEEIKKIFPNAIAAKDRRTVELNFPEE